MSVLLCSSSIFSLEEESSVLKLYNEFKVTLPFYPRTSELKRGVAFMAMSVCVYVYITRYMYTVCYYHHGGQWVIAFPLVCSRYRVRIWVEQT